MRRVEVHHPLSKVVLEAKIAQGRVMSHVSIRIVALLL